LRTVLVGAGKIAMGYADDPVRARHFPYATHAQVLAVHPAFDWGAVIDPSEEALRAAQDRWSIPCIAQRAEQIAHSYQADVAVLAAPPECRLGIIEQLPSVRAVMVEKPLGLTVSQSRDFLAHCGSRGIRVQVNLWRRGDDTFRALAAGCLLELIGTPQAAFGIYGNGLLNNGTHLVDLVRMLLGEVEAVQAVSGAPFYAAGPLSEDWNVAFNLRLCGGLVVMLQPVRFEHYRENSLEIWGEQARLAVTQEGLGIALYPRRESRVMQGEREIASDMPKVLESTVGRAFYNMYSNLAGAVHGEASLWSDGESALQTATVVEAILDSAHRNGVPVELAAVQQCSIQTS
jgi:predicted dehydrogenase